MKSALDFLNNLFIEMSEDINRDEQLYSELINAIAELRNEMLEKEWNS